MVNMASDNEIYIREALIALFGNLYKVSDEVSTQNITVTKDIIYLQPYTSTYTVDMVYKAEFKKENGSEIDFKSYLNINGYNYNSYVQRLLNNKPKDNVNNPINESNINIEIGSVLKTLPIQLQVNYKTPDTSIESFDTKYLFQPCNLGSKAPLMSMPGNYNSDTLYIYKDGQLQPWDTYTPSIYPGSYSAYYGDLIFYSLYNMKTNEPQFKNKEKITDINDIRFEKLIPDHYLNTRMEIYIQHQVLIIKMKLESVPEIEYTTVMTQIRLYMHLTVKRNQFLGQQFLNNYGRKYNKK